MYAASYLGKPQTEEPEMTSYMGDIAASCCLHRGNRLSDGSWPFDSHLMLCAAVIVKYQWFDEELVAAQYIFIAVLMVTPRLTDLGVFNICKSWFNYSAACFPYQVEQQPNAVQQIHLCSCILCGASRMRSKNFVCRGL